LELWYTIGLIVQSIAYPEYFSLFSLDLAEARAVLAMTKRLHYEYLHLT